MPAKDLPEDVKEKSKVVSMLAAHELAGWESGLILNKDGWPKANSVVNAQLYIAHDPDLQNVFSYDDFADRVVKAKPVPKLHMAAGYLSDDDTALVRAHMEKTNHLLFSKDNINDAIVVAAKANAYNPVKNRIESQHWDGKPRAERYFIDYLGAEDTTYTRAITRKWLSGAVARVYQPGCKFEIVPILEGKQGIGKSTAAYDLFPDKFNDSMQSLGNGKDDYQLLSGSWILEIAELSALKKTEIDRVKNFISARFDNYRASYGRNSAPHPRKCVFIGTTNQQDYLKDATGERRFFPIKCGVQEPTKNVWKPDPNDILQILAEVKTWVDHGEEIFLDKTMMATAKSYQEDAATTDPMKEAIDDYLAMKVPGNWADLSNSAKHSYFQSMEDHAKPGDWLTGQADMTHLEPIRKTTSREILAVVFDRTTDRYLSGRTNSDAKKIRLIMDNMPDWKVNLNVVVNGRRARGYERK
jgi:predicted P-loop ATPase